MELKSPAFSSFRYWIDVWDEAVDRGRIKELIEGNNFVFFFKKGDEIFGAPEESRLTFAKMKHPDEELPKDWAEEASFIALNFNKALQGERVRAIFNKKDLKEIEVLDPAEAEKLLTKLASDMPSEKKKYDQEIIMVTSDEPEDSNKAPNMKNLREKMINFHRMLEILEQQTNLNQPSVPAQQAPQQPQQPAPQQPQQPAQQAPQQPQQAQQAARAQQVAQLARQMTPFLTRLKSLGHPKLSQHANQISQMMNQMTQQPNQQG